MIWLLVLLAISSSQDRPADYVLGVDDVVVVRVLDLDEIKPDPLRIDMRGFINLPLVGRIQAGGRTVEQLEREIALRLDNILHKPEVTVSVQEFRSQPVSLLGSVRNPGVLQVRGRKTLYEVLSMAGGLNPDAGNWIHITRRKEAGALPLKDVRQDDTGDFWIGRVAVKSVMEAKNPEENIVIMPNDVISVPKADLVYVIGAVKRSGGFVLAEKEQLSALQALALAEGLDRGAAPKSAKILRQGKEGKRQEIPIDIKKIMSGKASDVPLVANDILFIPSSSMRTVGWRTFEAGMAIGTGWAIYRR